LEYKCNAVAYLLIDHVLPNGFQVCFLQKNDKIREMFNVSIDNYCYVLTKDDVVMMMGFQVVVVGW